MSPQLLLLPYLFAIKKLNYMNKDFEQKGLRIIQYGCGKMGKLLMKYAREKGATIVGVIDNNPSLVGKDIADLLELEQKTGILISSSPEDVFSKQPADVCIVAINSLMAEMYPLLSIPLRYGINTITICEEAFFPWTTSSEFTKRLDALAKENYCTLTASGYQDIFWGNLITTLAGASQKIIAIEGSSSYNVDDYGLALAKVHGVGLTPADFDAKIGQANILPSYMWNSSQWLATRFGWKIKNINQKLTPILADQAVFSKSLNQNIEKGNCLGMTATIILETEEGPIIQAKNIGKVYFGGECDTNDWKIKGTPTINVSIDNPATAELTCATIINRLPELMIANPGFMTTHNWPTPSYRWKPLSSYLPQK